MTSRTSRIISTIVKVGISVVALVLVLQWVDPAYLVRMIRTIKIPFFLAAVFAALMVHLFDSWRLSVIFTDSGRMTWFAFVANLKAAFFYNFSIGSTGQDAARIYFFGKQLKSISAAAGGLALDRIAGLVTQVIFAGVSLLVIWTQRFGSGSFHIVLAVSLIVFAAVLGGAGVVFFHSARILQWVQRKIATVAKDAGDLTEIFGSFRKNPWRFARVLGISALLHTAAIIVIMSITWALGGTLSFFEAAIIALAVSLASVLPVSLSGWGAVEWIYSFSFQFLDIGKAVGLSVSLVLRLVWAVPAIIGWILFLQSGMSIGSVLHAFRLRKAGNEPAPVAVQSPGTQSRP
jgi:uncharacterized protein (TIRG00374 family)